MINDELRTQLQGDAAGWDLSGLRGIDDITRAGSRRKTRRRIAPALVLMLLAGLGIAGMSSMQSTLPAQAVYMSENGPVHEPQPVDFVATDDGFLGFGYREVSEGKLVGVILQSGDGVKWTETVDLGEHITQDERVLNSYRLASDGEQFHLVRLTESSLSSSGAVITQLSSSDGAVWTMRERQIVSDERLPSNMFLMGVVVGDNATLIKVIESTFPGEVDPERICEVIAGPERDVYARACGSPDYVKDDAGGVRPTPGLPDLFIAAGEGAFVPVDGPFTSNSCGVCVGLFSADGAIGVVEKGLAEFESDGTWRVDSDVLKFPAIAAGRNDERLVVSRVQQQPGASGPQSVDAMFFDGAAWSPVELGSKLGGSSVASVHAGEAGWAIVTYRLKGLPQMGGSNSHVPSGPVDRHPQGSAFDLVNDEGWTFAGHSGWGPASLQDENGKTVREWNVFETERPFFHGAQIANGIVTLTNDDDEPIARFDGTEWFAKGFESPRPVAEIFWSPDGLNWTSVYDEGRTVISVAVGNDELVAMTSAITSDTVRIELPPTAD